MDKVRETELLHAVADYICANMDMEDLRREYNLTPDEYWWVVDALKDRGEY